MPDRNVFYDSMRMDTYHIAHGSFIDPKEKSILKTPWAKSGPVWRAAARGLSLEGTCTNSSCGAYKQRIIHQWGERDFDFFAQEHLCACPICGGYVQPISCGFTNTWWKISGYKKARAGSPPERVPGQWRFAPADGYTTFDENLTQVIQWKELQIKVDFWGSFWNILVCFFILVFLLWKGMSIVRLFRKMGSFRSDIVPDVKKGLFTKDCLDVKKGLFTTGYIAQIEQEIRKREGVDARAAYF